MGTEWDGGTQHTQAQTHRIQEAGKIKIQVWSMFSFNGSRNSLNKQIQDLNPKAQIQYSGKLVTTGQAGQTYKSIQGLGRAQGPWSTNLVKHEDTGQA